MTIREAADLLIYLGAIVGAVLVIWAGLRAFVVKPIKSNASRHTEAIRQSIKTLDVKVDGLGQRLTDHIANHGNK